MKETILQFLGFERYRVGHTEKLLSGLGAFLGIFLIFYSSSFFVNGSSLYLIVSSMGASAVLLFAVPHCPLSQPWQPRLAYMRRTSTHGYWQISTCAGAVLIVIPGRAVSPAVVLPSSCFPASGWLPSALAVPVVHYW